jgi:hypothetical protein
MNNERREGSRTLGGCYLIDKMYVFEISSMDRNIGYMYKCIIECKKGCQSRRNLVKDNCDLLADFHRILNAVIRSIVVSC